LLDQRRSVVLAGIDRGGSQRREDRYWRAEDATWRDRSQQRR
jgi:hypothetical protein